MTKPAKFDPSKPLANPRHEAFSQEIAKGSKYKTAFEVAGYKTKTDAAAYADASRLVRNAKVHDRVQYLQQRSADDAIITREWLIRECAATYRDARDADQHSAALKALELLGRERATFIPKAEIGRPGDFSEMTDAELDGFITREQGEIGRGAHGKALPDRGGGTPGKLH